MNANTRDFEAELEALDQELQIEAAQVQAGTEVVRATAL